MEISCWDHAASIVAHAAVVNDSNTKHVQVARIWVSLGSS